MTSLEVKAKRPIQKAQGLVEFALVLPILLVTIFVLIEVARVFHAWMAVENGARMGLRYATVAELDENNCANGGNNGGCFQPADEPDARVKSIHQAAWAGSTSIMRVNEGEGEEGDASYFKVTVCDPKNLIAPASYTEAYSCDPEDPGEPGDLVSVVVEFNHPLIVPILQSIWPHIHLSARRDGRVEDWKFANASGETPFIEVPIPSEPSPVSLCQSWADLHMHKPKYGEDSIEILIHEAHGWPNGPSVNQVILNSVTIQQGLENPILRAVEYLEVGHPPDANLFLPVNVKSFITTIPVQRQLVFCYDEYCDDAYRGSYVIASFDGSLDGFYSLEVEVYFPEYSETCTLFGEIDTNAPPPDPIDPDDPEDPEDPEDPPDPSPWDAPID